MAARYRFCTRANDTKEEKDTHLNFPQVPQVHADAFMSGVFKQHIVCVNLKLPAEPIVTCDSILLIVNCGCSEGRHPQPYHP